MLTVELDMRAGHLSGVVTVKLVAKQGFSAIGFNEHVYQRFRNRHPFPMSVEHTFVASRVRELNDSRVVLDDSDEAALYVTNAGRPFSRSNFHAIVEFGRSTLPVDDCGMASCLF